MFCCLLVCLVWFSLVCFLFLFCFVFCFFFFVCFLTTIGHIKTSEIYKIHNVIIFNFNPRLTKLVFVTCLIKGGLNRSFKLENKHPRYAYFAPSYSYGSPLSTHTKKIQTSHVWRHNDTIFGDFTQIADLQWNIGQYWIFHQKSSKYRNFKRRFAYKGRRL